LVFAQTFKERNVLAQVLITIVIVVPANKRSEDVVANPVKLVSSGHLKSDSLAANRGYRSNSR
jgi:hypothetical protein